MKEGSTDALAELLQRAQAAHGVYEAEELGGVYDAQWPRWYAAYLVEHGVAAVIGREVTVDEVARALELSWEAQKEEGVSADEWSVFTARLLSRQR